MCNSTFFWEVQKGRWEQPKSPPVDNNEICLCKPACFSCVSPWGTGYVMSFDLCCACLEKAQHRCYLIMAVKISDMVALSVHAIQIQNRVDGK